MIIDSFKTNHGQADPIGIPLGNVTSQLFANVYLHELDDFIKQNIKEKYYLRYCDDFIILSNRKDHLYTNRFKIWEFDKTDVSDLQQQRAGVAAQPEQVDRWKRL
jgi:hypothetical protein